MMHEAPKHRGRRIRILSLVFVVLVVLLGIAQISSIDWDIGQRRRQKTAFLLTRQLSVALEIFKRQNRGYPNRIQTLHNLFVENATANDEYHNREFAELSWQHIVDENHTFGYVYDYEPSQGLASDSQLFMHYELRADPVERGKSGFKSFYVGDNGSVRWNDERSATANDPVPDVDPVLDMHSYWTECLRRWKKQNLLTNP
jgi:hypothetical protein